MYQAVLLANPQLKPEKNHPRFAGEGRNSIPRHALFEDQQHGIPDHQAVIIAGYDVEVPGTDAVQRRCLAALEHLYLVEIDSFPRASFPPDQGIIKTFEQDIERVFDRTVAEPGRNIRIHAMPHIDADSLPGENFQDITQRHVGDLEAQHAVFIVHERLGLGDGCR